MGVRPAGLLLLACARTARAEDGGGEANETACRALGFGSSLLCASCTKLGDYVGADDPLVGECQGCCKEEAVGSGVVYASATLDVCR